MWHYEVPAAQHRYSASAPATFALTHSSGRYRNVAVAVRPIGFRGGWCRQNRPGQRPVAQQVGLANMTALTLNKITSQQGISVGEAAKKIADLGWNPSYVQEAMTFRPTTRSPRRGPDEAGPALLLPDAGGEG